MIKHNKYHLLIDWKWKIVFKLVIIKINIVVNCLSNQYELHSLFSDCLFVYLEFIVPLENCSLIWRRYHCRRRAANLTYARHSSPLSTEGSLTFHTYCDTGLPFIIFISEDRVWQWCCHYLFLRLRSVAYSLIDLTGK